MPEELFKDWDEELDECISEWKTTFDTRIVDDRNVERARIIEFWSGTALDPMSAKDMLLYIKQEVELGQPESDVSAAIANLLDSMLSDVELSVASRARLEKFTALAIQLGMSYEQFLFRRELKFADYGAKRRKTDKQSARNRCRISNVEAFERCESLKREHPKQSDRWIARRVHVQLTAENPEAAPAAETIRKKWLDQKRKQEIPF